MSSWYFWQVHAYIISELKNEMPMFFQREATKDKLIRELNLVYKKIQRKYNISAGDFPDCQTMQRKLRASCIYCISTLEELVLTIVWFHRFAIELIS